MSHNLLQNEHAPGSAPPQKKHKSIHINTVVWEKTAGTVCAFPESTGLRLDTFLAIFRTCAHRLDEKNAARERAAGSPIFGHAVGNNQEAPC